MEQISLKWKLLKKFDCNCADTDVGTNGVAGGYSGGQNHIVSVKIDVVVGMTLSLLLGRY